MFRYWSDKSICIHIHAFVCSLIYFILSAICFAFNLNCAAHLESSCTEAALAAGADALTAAGVFKRASAT